MEKSHQLMRLTRLVTLLLGDSSVLDPDQIPTFKQLAQFLENTSDIFHDTTSTTVLSLYKAAFLPTPQGSSTETCEICDETIQFAHATNATCAQGHEFCE